MRRSIPYCKQCIVCLLAVFVYIAGQPASIGGVNSTEMTEEMRGAIHGTIAIDAGRLIGFRVKARDPNARMVYNVFSRDGEYHVPDLTPGKYEVWVSQRGYQSTPETVMVEPGKTTRLALKATVKPDFDLKNQFRPRDPHTRQIRKDAKLVEFDKLYPPEPGRAELIDHCFACHATVYDDMRLSREGWDLMLRRMTDRLNMPGQRKANIIYTKENFPEKDRQRMLDYLTRHFGPDAPNWDLKLDELVPNEDILSNAVFIEYEIPLAAEDYNPRSYHDPYIAPNGEVWFNDRANRSLVHIDPDARDSDKRIIEEYQTPWPETSMHGITIDSQGRVYYSDINGGYLGELDRETGEFKRYETTGDMKPPWSVPEGTRTSESAVQIVVDSKDNVWGNLVSGNRIYKLDAETREISLWDLPTPDTNPYGLIASHDDKIWTAGISADKIVKFDPATETFTEYPTPTQPSAPRRLGEDSEGNIWWAEYVGGHLGRLDPETEEMTEFSFPLEHTSGYDAWPVQGLIWVTDATYQTLISFDPETKEFVYYPLPMIQPSPNPGVPKLEVERDGTIWFAYRGLRRQPNPVVEFLPHGNAEAWD